MKKLWEPLLKNCSERSEMLSLSKRISSVISVMLFIAVTLCFISSCSGPKDISAGLAYDGSSNFWYSEKEEYKGLVEVMRQYCSNYPEIRGTYLLATDDDVIFIGGMNSRETDGKTPVDAYTTYEIGSLTKVFTATAIFQLVEKGRLSLDDTIDKFFPEYAHGKEITIFSLLHMQSGIRRELMDVEPESLETVSKEDIEKFRKYWFADGFSDKELLDELFAADLDYEPGTKYQYSNAGYFLLAKIIEKASGMKYRDYLKKHIFDVCNLKHTTSMEHGGLTSVPETTFPNAATPYEIDKVFEDLYIGTVASQGSGDIHSCAADLLAFDRALIGGKLIKDGSLTQMLHFELGYGCGWMEVRGMSNAYFHSGGTPLYHAENTYCKSKKYGNVYLIQLHSTYADAKPAEAAIQNVLFYLGRS